MQYNAHAIFTTIYMKENKDFKPIEKKQVIAKIRTELKRLSDRKKIDRKTRGFYQAKPFPHVIAKLENPEVRIHGIKIEINIAENNIKGILPITPGSNIVEDWLVARGFEPISNNRFCIVKWWENRKVTVTFHVSGLVEIFIRASSNPLGFFDFDRLLMWFNGFFDPFLFEHSDMWVRQIGFNRDFRLLRLEGVSSVSLQVMRNVWSQVYQKDGCVRFEHHLVFPRLCLDVDAVSRSLLLLTSPLGDCVDGGVDNSGDMFE